MQRIKSTAFAALFLLAGANNAQAACSGLETYTCVLPFPSNEYAVEDNQSSTGIRVAITDDVLPPAKLDLLPSSVRPAAVLNGRDGFSPMGAAMFELDPAVPVDDWLQNPSAWVHAYSVDTGKPVDVVVNRSPVENSGKFTWGPIVEVYPAARFPFGERIVIALTTPDQSAAPANYAPTTRQLSADALQVLQQNAVDESAIISATEYTIASADSIIEEHRRGQNAIADFDYPIEITKTTYYTFGDTAARIRGKVLLPDFRGEDGLVDVDNDAVGNAKWVPFDLYLPRSAKNKPAPVMIYGHGIVANRQTVVFVLAQNSDNGIATLAIDQPNHGSRIDPDGGYVFDLLRMDSLPRALGMVMESSFDMHGLVSMIEKKLNTLDALPRYLWGSPGDGVPDLDTSKILYSGTSLGGVLGSGFAAFDDRVDGAYLQVAGTGIARIMTHSMFWGLGFKNLISSEFTAGETAFQAMIAQHAIDMVEGGILAESFNRETKPMFLQYGVDDTVAINASTFSLARIAGLNLNEPVIADVPGFAVNETPDDLMGLLQIAPASQNGWLYGFTAHTTFIRGDAFDAYNHWLEAINARWEE